MDQTLRGCTRRSHTDRVRRRREHQLKGTGRQEDNNQVFTVTRQPHKATKEPDLWEDIMPGEPSRTSIGTYQILQRIDAQRQSIYPNLLVSTQHVSGA